MTLAYDSSSEALFSPQDQDIELPPPPPGGPGELALAAELSRLAYLRVESGQGPRLNSALARWGFGAASPFAYEQTGTQGFGAVRASDGLAVVAIRGTQPDALEDYFSDAKALPVPWRGGGAARVHAGFQASAASIETQATGWLAALRPAPRRVLVCGHSLGAAVATLLARPLAAHHLVTFGSPRVGDLAFRAALASPPGLAITRVVDCVDMVTMVPPGLEQPLGAWAQAALELVQTLPKVGWLPGRMSELARYATVYCHVGQLLYIAHDGRLIFGADDDTVQTDRQTPAVWRPAIGWGQVPTRLLSDHAPINYVRALWPSA